ncbi:hypothetical protein AAES_96516 [Amazona aestiva]|uniref:Uncharacterized protein n=1 Tax=Amazona aestiva TaxID=12930 RepID=A0A0Q3THZ5_AMAAE|nr:hypothetical protein AAES_96516 [Amazona aestiva]
MLEHKQKLSCLHMRQSARDTAGAPGAMAKASHRALGTAGPPAQDPFQVPWCLAIQGVDECPGEDQQTGEAGSAERKCGSSLPAPQGLAQAGTHMQNNSMPEIAIVPVSHLGVPPFGSSTTLAVERTESLSPSVLAGRFHQLSQEPEQHP